MIDFDFIYYKKIKILKIVQMIKFITINGRFNILYTKYSNFKKLLKNYSN